MVAHVNALPDDIHMSSIFWALKKSVKKLVLMSTLFAAVTFAILTLVAPKYQSEAELQIDARGAANAFQDGKASAAGPDTITTKMDKEAINTHVKALKSADLLAKIAEQMALKDSPEFNDALGPVDKADSLLRMIGVGGPRAGESEHDRVLNTLRNQLEVYTAKESRFIGVRMTSINAELAAKVANSVAETYRTSLANDSVVEVDDQQKVIEGKIEKLKPELAALETEVDRYRREIDSYKSNAQNGGTLNEQQMSELTAELVRAKGTRGEAEARAKSAKEMMKLGSADVLPDVQKSPLIQNLVQQRVRIERQISELSASLLPGHPRMQQLNADLAGLKKQLAGEISKLVDSLEKEAKVAQGREDSIKKSLDDIKSKVTTNAPEEAQLKQLESDASAKRTELGSLQNQLEANRKKTDIRGTHVEVKVISEAQAASVPVFPKKLPLSALVGVASLIFGAAWTVLRALFSGARSGALGAPVSAHGRPSAAQRAEPVLDAGTTLAIAEKIQAETDVNNKPATEFNVTGIARRLASHRPARGGHRTLITGETGQVDPGAAAVELVKALSDTDATVVLVDWSPSGAGIAGRVGSANKHGLTELLAGDAGFDQVVSRIPSSTVHFIGCGAPLDSVAEEIEPDHLNLVLDALDEAYDHIVVAGRHEDARFLFEVIQGRFDAGVLVADGRKSASVGDVAAGTFLGFEVADIDVIRFESAADARAPNKRIARATQKSVQEARAI